jgi:hypothetical protein
MILIQTVKARLGKKETNSAIQFDVWGISTQG